MKMTRLLTATLVMSVLMLSSSITAFAGGSEYTEETTLPIDVQSNEDVSFTPDGNLTLIDDVTVTDEMNKQFIIAQSKTGSYFYIVIDRSGDSENVYLLNLVDEEDLIALVNGEPVPLEPSEPRIVEEPISTSANRRS